MSQRVAVRGQAFRATVAVTEFAARLGGFLPAPETVFCAEPALSHWRQGVCIAAALPEGLELAHLDQGRVFNATWELRWHVDGGQVALLLLTEQEQVPAPWTDWPSWHSADAGYEVQPTCQLLIGKSYRHGTEEFFAEAAVPHLFRYPLPAQAKPEASHACLHGKHYRRGGRTVLTRFTHLARIQEREAERQ